MRIKLITAASVIAQIIAFTLMIVLGVKFWIVSIVVGVLVIANIVLFSAMMTKTETSTNKKSTKGSPWKFEQ
jgi:membrane protein implicated in regulation of membrane protease activity